MDEHDKITIALRYWLLGRKYYKAANAVELAVRYHTGLRKDGVTPEVDHPFRVAHLVRTFETDLIHPEETIAAAILHDVMEDHDVSYDVISSATCGTVAASVRNLSKTGKTTDQYFNTLKFDPIGSVVKGCDRINNIHTMPGVFSGVKQLSYVQEVDTYFFPMLKHARRMFHRQESIYENIKFTLETQRRYVLELNKES